MASKKISVAIPLNGSTRTRSISTWTMELLPSSAYDDKSRGSTVDASAKIIDPTVPRCAKGIGALSLTIPQGGRQIPQSAKHTLASNDHFNRDDVDRRAVG